MMVRGSPTRSYWENDHLPNIYTSTDTDFFFEWTEKVTTGTEQQAREAKS